ncbi:modular serine protease-like [Daktulosphaira vitifoliae]|uniref:modular serine protease-like n=1 Tax=Daktulosphaira vitifoliae TaxID=58002 RepID=UPI0021AAFCF8|nr:modular serine protease-like [Daktulosphaira vitifoliae]
MQLVNNWINIYLFLFLTKNVFGSQHFLHKRQTSNNCPINTFQCSNGACIDTEFTCDGNGDCPDNSDETEQLCSTISCPGFAFRCKYGACIDKSSKCNGNVDCIDGSDENDSSCMNIESTASSTSQVTTKKPIAGCTSNEFQCTSGKCIDSISICDGTADCSDGTDETRALCGNERCQGYSFKCAYGACIPKENRCDGVKNCVDNSDEVMCNQNNSIVFKPKPSTATATTKPTTKPTVVQLNVTNACTVPRMEGSDFSLINSDHTLKSVSPGTKINQNNFILEKCKTGYTNITSHRPVACLNGNWFPVFNDVLCLKNCPSVTSESLNLECRINDDIVNCSKPVRQGTIMRPSCKQNYRLENGEDEIPIELFCQKNGQWSGKLFKCIPICGRILPKSQILISNGNKTVYDEVPWNVGVYEHKNNVYEHICGGTLIARNIVLSAAHCFWTDGQKNRDVDHSNYKISVGKYTRDYGVPDNHYTRIHDVKQIFIGERFNGESSLYSDDIAVIILSDPVVISPAVSVVCVDWKPHYTEQNGNLGLVVGWGRVDKMKEIYSQTLLKAELPYIDYPTCRKMVKEEFSVFITFDKFCAGTKKISDQGVQKGDSGAGLSFIHDNKYYLRGIVSLNDPNANDSIALFTDIKRHLSWLLNIYLKNRIQ